MQRAIGHSMKKKFKLVVFLTKIQLESFSSFLFPQIIRITSVKVSLNEVSLKRKAI